MKAFCVITLPGTAFSTPGCGTASVSALPQLMRYSQSGEHLAANQVLQLDGKCTASSPEKPIVTRIADELIDGGSLLRRRGVEEKGSVGSAGQTTREMLDTG